jgi:hypothetical protein
VIENPLFNEIRDERYIQEDGYSCGIFVSMFAEGYLHGYALEEASPVKTPKSALEKKKNGVFHGNLATQRCGRVMLCMSLLGLMKILSINY